MPELCRQDGGAPRPGGSCPCRQPALPPPLICQGRPVDPTGQPVGEPCGREYPALHRLAYGSLDITAGWATRPETTAEHADRTRRAGWLVEPIPCCPWCRRPAPSTSPSTRRPRGPEMTEHDEAAQLRRELADWIRAADQARRERDEARAERDQLAAALDRALGGGSDA